MALLCGIALAASAPALALTGTVVDGQGDPIEGARVCYFVDSIEELCSLTDDAGFFEVPDSRLDTIRIVAAGHLPRTLPAVEQDAPIVMEAAAAILVRLIDAGTGGPIERGRVEILHSSGKLRRFPCNRAGVRVRTYEPGLVNVTGLAEGYRTVQQQRVELEAGKEAEVEIRMEREESATEGEAAASEEE